MSVPPSVGNTPVLCLNGYTCPQSSFTVGYRYGHIWKANRKSHSSFQMFGWPWVTSNTDFKVTIIRGRSRSLKMAPFDRAYDFLSVSHCKYSSMLHHFCAIAYLEWLTNRKSYALSNGTIFNDLERPLPPVSRSRHSLTLNISETVRDTQFQWNTNRDVLLDSLISNELEWLTKIFNDTKRRAVSLQQLSFLSIKALDEKTNRC